MEETENQTIFSTEYYGVYNPQFTKDEPPSNHSSNEQFLGKTIF